MALVDAEMLAALHPSRKGLNARKLLEGYAAVLETRPSHNEVQSTTDFLDFLADWLEELDAVGKAKAPALREVAAGLKEAHEKRDRASRA